MDTVIELSEAEKAKIKQNEQEELLFRKNLHSLINGDRKLASKPLVIGKTPYSLAVCGADSNLLLTINKKVINKAMRPEVRDENGKLVGKTGHGLSEDNIVQVMNEIKNPAMIFKGSHDNSLLVITNIKDINNRNIVAAVDLNKKEGFETVNQILSSYGRDNLSEYIEKNINNGNLIAINKEKANEMLHSIEKWYLKENTFISFDNSIAYSTANVKYISEISQNIFEEEKFPTGELEREALLLPVEITQADIDVLRTLEPRKSILNFSSSELAATEKWAEKFQSELSEKSPFYRHINGDWRENDETRVPIIDVVDKSPTFQSVRNDIKQQVIFRGSVINSDTDWNIQISRKGLEDTVHYANKHNDTVTLNVLYNINDILTNAVMLDSTLTDDNNPNKANNTAFMHKMYAVCKIDENVSLAKIAVEEFASGRNDTLRRMYNMRSIEIEPLRHVAFTDKRLALSVLNGSDISISDLFKLVKSFDKDFYLNKRREQQIEKFPTGETERNGNMSEAESLLLERIAALEKQVAVMTAEQQNLKEQINTVNQFISSITESQNFEQSMATIESMGKQVLDCGKAEFWCYDGAENKYFTNDENRGGRDWQIAKENMRIAADTKEAYIADNTAYIPIISNDKVAGILVAGEKDGVFDRASLEKFAPNGQIANTIDLSLKKEFEHQGRITDELTRLKNRQGAKEYAANTMAHNVNAQKDMCLIMCDIDHFKSINDTYGHDAGDTVLKNVAGILQSGTRQGADSAFRWGGEEMVCVLNCDYDHAMDIAERLRQQIESATHLVYNADKQPTNVSVTISMGVYQVKPDKEITQENAFSFFENQLKYADALAYEAKETGRNKVVGENDIMQEKNVEKENYSIFLIDNGVERKYFRDDNTDVNALVQRLADGNLTYPEISKNCTEISDLGFAELEQSEKNPPSFCAEINLDTKDIVGNEKPMDITVWDNDKTATISLDEAIRSIKENGTVNLDYQKFAENNDTVELASEYLDFSEDLDNAYDDFLYHNGIFNDEHINFVDEHGELPSNLNTAENRAVVSEYINIQLESGSNLSESQKETLTELKQQISEISEMESELNIDEGDLKFIAETKNIGAWSDEAQEKYSERNAGLDEQDRNNVER